MPGSSLSPFLPLSLLLWVAPACASELPLPPGCALQVEGLPLGAMADPSDPRLRGAALLVVEKGARRLGLYREGALAGCWPVGLAAGYPPGPKRRQGDRRTPEGWYRTSDKPWSQFPGAIAVHYPNAEDARAGVQEGILSRAQERAVLRALAQGQKPEQGTPMGGEILLHGGGGDRDWTLGCVALDDEDLQWLRAALPEAQRTDLLILP